MARRRRSLEEIIASDPRFRNVDPAVARRYYESVVNSQQANNETALSDVIVTAESPHPPKRSRGTNSYTRPIAAADQTRSSENERQRAMRMYVEERTGQSAPNPSRRYYMSKQATRDLENAQAATNALSAYNDWAAHNPRAVRDMQTGSYMTDQNMFHRANVAAADRRVQQTAFSDPYTVNLLFTLLSPAQIIGALYDSATGYNTDKNKSYLGNAWESLRHGNYGVMPREWAEKHPTLAMFGNMGFDIGVGGITGAMRGVGSVGRATLRGAKAGYNGAKNLWHNVIHPFGEKGSFTRGLGMTDAGLQDMVESGVIRGNPKGTEVNAAQFQNYLYNNRNHFRDVIDEVNIPNVEKRFFARELTEADFNAMKKAAAKYDIEPKTIGYKADGTPIKLKTKERLLGRYKDYDDYLRQVEADKQANLKAEPGSKIGINSHINADGNPISFYYSDGRNPFKRGYNYVGDEYAVKIRNAADYDPFIHPEHQHYSLRRSPSLLDPNVQVYKRGRFGQPVRLNKRKLIEKYSKDAEFTAPEGSATRHTIRPLSEESVYGTRTKQYSLSDKLRGMAAAVHGRLFEDSKGYRLKDLYEAGAENRYQPFMTRKGYREYYGQLLDNLDEVYRNAQERMTLLNSRMTEAYPDAVLQNSKPTYTVNKAMKSSSGIKGYTNPQTNGISLLRQVYDKAFRPIYERTGRILVFPRFRIKDLRETMAHEMGHTRTFANKLLDHTAWNTANGYWGRNPNSKFNDFFDGLAARGHGAAPDELLAEKFRMAERYGVKSLDELTPSQWSEMVSNLKGGHMGPRRGLLDNRASLLDMILQNTERIGLKYGGRISLAGSC